MRYLKALCPSMNTTGTWSLNSRRSCVSLSTSTSCQVKPPRRESLVRLSFTTSQRWQPLREYTTTCRGSCTRGLYRCSGTDWQEKRDERARKRKLFPVEE